MLRKCLQDEDIPYPHSVIDFYDNVKIIDIPETYTVYQPLFYEGGDPIVEQVGTIKHLIDKLPNFTRFDFQVRIAHA